MIWHFIGVYIINRTLHGRSEIRNFSSRAKKYLPVNVLRNISLVRCAHSKGNFVSPRGHVISSINFVIYLLFLMLFYSSPSARIM